MENIAAVIDTNVVTVSCEFTEQGKRYTYKVPKNVAETLSEGDYVLVDASEARGVPASLAKVCEVHSYNAIEPQSTIVYKWAFAKVPLDVLAELLKKEQHLVAVLRERQQHHLRQQALAELGIPASDIATITKEA